MSSSDNNEAGLFSASLTAFIIQSYKMLIPNNSDTMVLLLERVTQQLAAMSNASTSAHAPASVAPDPFVPTASAVVCNVLWFLSLGFSLACALSATLVEQWVRNYLLATEGRPLPHERARVFEYLYKGLQKFRMAAVVETIPMLLHISLFLFFAGLVEFLRPVNFVISMLIFAMLLFCIMIYALVTVIPAFHRNCPYRTPFSGWFWRVMQALHLLRHCDPATGRTMEIVGSMTQAREMEAVEISTQRDQRDLDAMCWTLKALREDTELEPFIEVIPQVVAGSDYSGKLLLHNLLHFDDLSVRLDHRITRLLLTCSGSLLEPSVCQKRATTCLAAIWSLTMMSIISGPSSSPRSRALRFDEHTLRDMTVVKVAVPGAADYAISAMAVVARSVLDMYLECVAQNEQTLLAIIGVEGGVWHQEKVPQHQRIRPEYVHIFNMIQRRSQGWERYLRPGEGPMSMPLFVILSCLNDDLTKLVSIATAHADDLILATETLNLLRNFRAMINQLGFSLTIEYAANLISRSPPFEAFNTLRRLFLTVDFVGHLSVESQRRLVAVLDDALEPDPKGETRIPQSVLNIMLGLTAAVKDPASAIKAVHIISRNMKFFSSEDEAHRAISLLNNAMPRLTPTLDLFSWHMYANTKLDR
jgi:hypothetical protein